MKAKKALAKSQGLILLSGGQDSNLRPPGPKPGEHENQFIVIQLFTNPWFKRTNSEAQIEAINNCLKLEVSRELSKSCNSKSTEIDYLG